MNMNCMETSSKDRSMVVAQYFVQSESWINGKESQILHPRDITLNVRRTLGVWNSRCNLKIAFVPKSAESAKWPLNPYSRSPLGWQKCPQFSNKNMEKDIAGHHIEIQFQNRLAEIVVLVRSCTDARARALIETPTNSDRKATCRIPFAPSPEAAVSALSLLGERGGDR